MARNHRLLLRKSTDGPYPRHRGVANRRRYTRISWRQKAIFLIMVRDLDPEAATLIAAATAKPAKTKKTKLQPEADSARDDAESAAESAESAESTAPRPQPTEPQPEPTPSPAPASAPIRKRKNSPRYFCGRPLY